MMAIFPPSYHYFRRNPISAGSTVFVIHIISFVYLLNLLFVFCFLNRAADPTEKSYDELKICCGQLVSMATGWQHRLCDGREDEYHIGGLVIELEKCPHMGCGSRFSMNPIKNIAHQDLVHHSILLHSCAICRGCYVMEGALHRHVIRGHGGPVGFEVGMNEKHGPEYMIKVPLNY